MALRTTLLPLILLLFGGCGSSPEEVRRSLQGTWIAGDYLDSLSSTGSPLRAARMLRGISDFHYDPERDSVTLGFNAATTVAGKGLTVLDDGRLSFAGEGIALTFDPPRGADRIQIGSVELRRVSRVPEMTIGEYLVRRFFAGTYVVLEPAGQDSAMVVSPGGAVKGLGDIISLTPVADYSGPFPAVDAVQLETLFQPDTLYYAWQSRGDTVRGVWLAMPDRPGRRPPQIPGSSFTVLRQNR